MSQSTAALGGRWVLDAAVCAPLRPRAAQALAAAGADAWADPRAGHAEGRRAAAVLDGAREALAGALGARTEEVHLLPSHAMALATGVLGVLRTRPAAARRALVRSAVEHSAVIAAGDVHAAGGGRVEEVGVDAEGRLDPAAWGAALGRDAALAALVAASAEVGTLQPVAAAAAAARAAGVPLLLDAAAAAGQVALPPGWDLLAADARSWGGPGGLGVLVVRAGVRWSSPWPEDDAPGSPSPGGVPAPVALAGAVALVDALAERDAEDVRRRALVARLRERVPALVPDVEVVGDAVDRLPHVVAFSALHADGEALVAELDRAGVGVGSGSACTSSSLRPSHVLAAMGALTHGSVRVGLPAGTPPGHLEAGVERLLAALPGAVARVRALLGAEGL